jgi:uncharacterized protein (TIGR02145 family)
MSKSAPLGSVRNGLSVQSLPFIPLIFIFLLAVSCSSDDKPTKSSPPTSVTDVDGNLYQVVTIGTQTWMAENLKVQHYRNGDPIPNVTADAAWMNSDSGAYCNLKNNAINVDSYGRLYNWYAVNDARKIAPIGWHVPTDAEWQTLIDYLGGPTVAGIKLKESGMTHWNSSGAEGTNESGFTALPGEFRNWNGDWSFTSSGANAFFWSATESDVTNAWDRRLYYNLESVSHDDWDKHNGMSIRCIAD